eukprot:TRINITY_DN953_c0_g2_i1.p1 TRINITY_DN953_c0_g2~~TRINITY_DN953_c0_g2_i1.p1  ORF type:complete len:289 (-),score=136.28 TRINITY_DN953_c0_g2_i1:62-928(-)
MPIESFIFGGISGIIATCFVQPFDLAKTRLQLGGAKEYKSTLEVFLKVIKNEGFFALYNGLSAGILRQATYTTARLGIFQISLDYLSNGNTKKATLFDRLAAGCLGGGIGAIVGNPAEVALVRMTADGRLPVEQRRGYKNAFHALYSVTINEGPLTLWRGTIPTVTRAVVINCAQLAGYSQAKSIILNSGFKDGLTVHISSSLLAGLLATAASIPFDMAKTKLQAMKIINGVPEYTGVLDVITKQVKNGGLLTLWKGFTPYFLRLGPHTVITFVVLEKLLAIFGFKSV